VSAIIDLLLKVQLIDDRQHDAVMSRSKGGSGGHIVQQVAEMGYATEGTIARAISVELGLPRIDLGMTPPEPQAIALLDARTCAERFVLPVALRENGELLWLAMADPTDQETIAVVRRKAQKRVRPAVAGPSEILRSIRTLYSSPDAGRGNSEAPPPEKLAAIEIADQAEGEGGAFEIVGVSDESSNPELARIAAQLGVEVPANIPSRQRRSVTEEIEIIEGEPEPTRDRIDARPEAPQRSIPPQGAPQGLPRPPSSVQAGPRTAAPRAPAARHGDELDQLLPAEPGAIADDLAEEDLATLEALRASMEKGALVMRAIAELCVEKGVFTREEMKKRGSPR
jgi:hypothetical protein